MIILVKAQNSMLFVILAKAGIYCSLRAMDARLPRLDQNRRGTPKPNLNEYN